jgi:hypothetical protein
MGEETYTPDYYYGEVVTGGGGYTGAAMDYENADVMLYENGDVMIFE